jgi:hypothetical protein
MHARNHTRGRAPATLLSLCLGLASACSAEPPAGPIAIPLGESLPALEYTITVTYTDPPPSDIDRPEAFSGHLYLEIDDDGRVTGMMSARGDYDAGLDTFEAHVEGTEIVLDNNTLIEPGEELTVRDLSISLFDHDGDGTADAAEGEAYGSWIIWISDFALRYEFNSVLTAGRDTTAKTARMSWLGSREQLLPYSSIYLAFDEPLLEAEVRDNLRILANGTAIPGELMLYGEGEMITRGFFQPDAFLAFGAEVTIDHGDLKDPSGNAVSAAEVRAPVMADPGVFTGNAGFESGLNGWLAVGEVGTRRTFEGYSPEEGAAQALVRVRSMLVTYLDVPAEATALELSITVFSEDFGGPARIFLYLPGGEEIELFSAGDLSEQVQPCPPTCLEFETVLGPLRPTLDLTPYRGQRVFVSIEVQPTGLHGEDDGAALIDDVQIR